MRIFGWRGGEGGALARINRRRRLIVFTDSLNLFLDRFIESR